MLDLFKKEPFSKNVLILISGTTISHLIPLILYPAFTRLFTPADFGLFALFISIISLIDVISTGRLELAVVLPEKDKDSINVIAAGISFLLIICIILYLPVILLSDFISLQINNPEIKQWLFLAPIAIFIMGISKLFNYWLIRKKSFALFAANKIYQRILEGVFTLGFKAAKFSNGLIVGDFVGRFSLAAISLFQAVKKGFMFNLINKRDMLKMVKRYKEYPLYNTIPSLLNTSCTLLPVFLISSFYDESTTGYYNLSRQILAIPIALISANISQVLLRDITEKRNRNQMIYNDIKSLFYKLAVLSALFIIILFFSGPYLFGFFFGSDWKISGEYTQILVFSYAFSFIVTPLSSVFIALEKVKILSIWQISYFTLVCLLFFARYLEVKKFLLLVTIIDMLAFSVYLFLILKVAKKFDKFIYKI